MIIPNYSSDQLFFIISLEFLVIFSIYSFLRECVTMFCRARVRASCLYSRQPKGDTVIDERLEGWTGFVIS